MIPLLPNPFNPEDTEFVLDADSFMAALAPSHETADTQFAGPARPRFLQRERVRLQRLRPQETNTEPTDQHEEPTPRFAPDAAGRRLDTPTPPPLRDEEELFYLAGADPRSLAPDVLANRAKRK